MPKKKPESCAYCGEPATLYCDFVIGSEPAGYTQCGGQAAINAGRFEEYVPGKGLPYVRIDSAMHTCDAPICAACSRRVGTLFMCGDKKHSHADTIDLCYHHKKRDLGTICVTAENAEKIRVQIWKKNLARTRPLRLFAED